MPHGSKNEVLKVGDRVTVGGKPAQLLAMFGFCQCVVLVDGRTILATASQLTKAA